MTRVVAVVTDNKGGHLVALETIFLIFRSIRWYRGAKTRSSWASWLWDWTDEKTGLSVGALLSNDLSKVVMSKLATEGRNKHG